MDTEFETNTSEATNTSQDIAHLLRPPATVKKDTKTAQPSIIVDNLKRNPESQNINVSATSYVDTVRTETGVTVRTDVNATSRTINLDSTLDQTSQTRTNLIPQARPDTIVARFQQQEQDTQKFRIQQQEQDTQNEIDQNTKLSNNEPSKTNPTVQQTIENNPISLPDTENNQYTQIHPMSADPTQATDVGVEQSYEQSIEFNTQQDPRTRIKSPNGYDAYTQERENSSRNHDPLDKEETNKNYENDNAIVFEVDPATGKPIVDCETTAKASDRLSRSAKGSKNSNIPNISNGIAGHGVPGNGNIQDISQINNNIAPEFGIKFTKIN